MSPPTILVSRPDYDNATRWGQYWFNELVVKPAQAKGFDVVDLYRENAVRDVFYKSIDDKNPVYITGSGHGNNTTFTGNGGSVLLRSGEEDTIKRAPNRHFHLLSCNTAIDLGKRLVEYGAKGYHGYACTYTFVISTFPNKYAEPFFDSDETIDRELIEGKTHGEAKAACLAKYDYWIENAPEVCRSYLLYDKEGYRFYGDGNSRITAPPPRRGKPCESAPFTITYHPRLPPPEAEETQMTLTDKSEYYPDEEVALTATLTFVSDGVPLPNREIILYENAIEKARGTTDIKGQYVFKWTAPDVPEDTVKNYKGRFPGDV